MTIHLSRRDFVKHASLLSAASAFGVRHALAADTFVVADTTAGKVRGVEVEGIKIFKGVPYGANTTGTNRFMPPAPVPKWTGVRDALEYGPSAPQTEPGARRNASDLAVAGAGLPQEGEDCLVLNVWTPALDDGRKRPVMVWCHGGGFSSGSGSSPITAGLNLARRGDVVVVTINHRLNVLGFTYLGEPAARILGVRDVGRSTSSARMGATIRASAAIPARSPVGSRRRPEVRSAGDA
jgi:para-nitrobenzyl esterase